MTDNLAKLYCKLYDVVSLIKCSELRELCIAIIAKSKKQLKQPSSSSGMHHPQDELCEGGQIIHILKVANLSLHALRRRDLDIFSKDIIDIVIASAVLHDIPLKFEINKNSVKIEWNHGYLNAKHIELVAGEFNIDSSTLEAICHSVCFHMGKWSPINMGVVRSKCPIKTELLNILQEADYYSSRKNIIVDYSIELTKELIEDILNATT